MIAELVGETGRFERELPVVLVDVELAPLRAGLRGGLRLVDRRGDAVDVEDASKDEATEARTDYGDWCRHRVPFKNHMHPGRHRNPPIGSRSPGPSPKGMEPLFKIRARMR
jgi:hypothetical protein